MAVNNKHIYSDNQDELKTLREEYAMIGFDTTLESGKLTVYALKRKKPKKKKDEDEKSVRDKRTEKYNRE